MRSCVFRLQGRGVSSLIKAGFLITDLNLFFDAGLAFYDKTSFSGGRSDAV
jgi:hypothetical protein